MLMLRRHQVDINTITAMKAQGKEKKWVRVRATALFCVETTDLIFV